MKDWLKKRWFLLVLVISILGVPVSSYGEETEIEVPPVYGREIEDGSYEIQVKSSSSMFRIVKAQLNVENGSMTADITLSGTGYLKLFMGTGQEALEAGEESYIPYAEDEEGAYTYTIPVEALNVEFPCAAYSKRKETWYDRELVIWSDQLPGECLKPALLWEGKDNGDYTMEVSLEGGTGRATVASPAKIRIADGEIRAFIQWSSLDYDYMIVNGEKYLPISSKGGSLFEIPVSGEETDVIADTVAMSSPHEIEYTLIFHGDTIKKEGNIPGTLIGGLVLAAVAAVILIWMRRRRNRADSHDKRNGEDV